jgi:hypothetical protein
MLCHATELFGPRRETPPESDELTR